MKRNQQFTQGPKAILWLAMATPLYLRLVKHCLKGLGVFDAVVLIAIIEDDKDFVCLLACPFYLISPPLEFLSQMMVREFFPDQFQPGISPGGRHKPGRKLKSA